MKQRPPYRPLGDRGGFGHDFDEQDRCRTCGATRAQVIAGPQSGMVCIRGQAFQAAKWNAKMMMADRSVCKGCGKLVRNGGGLLRSDLCAACTFAQQPSMVHPSPVVAGAYSNFVANLRANPNAKDARNMLDAQTFAKMLGDARGGALVSTRIPPGETWYFCDDATSLVYVMNHQPAAPSVPKAGSSSGVNVTRRKSGNRGAGTYGRGAAGAGAGAVSGAGTPGVSEGDAEQGEGDDAEPLKECIVAWKAVKCSPHGILRSASFRSNVIEPRSRMVAACGKAGSRHEAPNRRCNCGFHAAGLVRTAAGYVSHPDVWHGDFPVIGAFNLWGRVEMNHNGYRAQFAYPKELFIVIGQSPSGARNWGDQYVRQDLAFAAAKRVSALYGVPCGVIMEGGFRELVNGVVCREDEAKVLERLQGEAAAVWTEREMSEDPEFSRIYAEREAGVACPVCGCEDARSVTSVDLDGTREVWVCTLCGHHWPRENG